jgi:hypothetical protein
MRVQKMLKHRSMLSYKKHWMWMRKNGKLIMWWRNPDFIRARGQI